MRPPASVVRIERRLARLVAVGHLAGRKAGFSHVSTASTTPFDVEAFLKMSLESGMPHAEWWANSWMLDLTT